MKKLTKKGLIAYAEANPNRTVKCGDMSKCLIADYAAHELLEKGEKYVQVDGERLRTFAHDPAMKYTPEEVETVMLPAWAVRTIERFDALDGADLRTFVPRRVKLATVLKKNIIR